MAYGIQGRENPLLTEIKEISNDIWLKTTSDGKDVFRDGYTKKEELEQIYRESKQTYLGEVKEVR